MKLSNALIFYIVPSVTLYPFKLIILPDTFKFGLIMDNTPSMYRYVKLTAKSIKYRGTLKEKSLEKTRQV